jgi:hypothetical protein
MCASTETDVRESASDCTLASGEGLGSGGETSHQMSLKRPCPHPGNGLYMCAELGCPFNSCFINALIFANLQVQCCGRLTASQNLFGLSGGRDGCFSSALTLRFRLIASSTNQFWFSIAPNRWKATVKRAYALCAGRRTVIPRPCCYTYTFNSSRYSLCRNVRDTHWNNKCSCTYVKSSCVR